MLIDQVWWGQCGKYLARGHEEKTSLRSIRRSWSRAKYFFPSGPSTQWISAQYVGFVRHTFITHDAIEHKKWKVLFLFFNRKCQALVFIPLKGVIFITRSITVQPKFLFFNAKLSLRDNRLSVFVNFSFSSGCDLHDWRQNYLKKTKWLYFGLARHTFITNDGYKIIEVVRTLL